MSLKPDQALFSIGFDKNGECDFAIRMSVAELSTEGMNELRRMIPVAIAELERTWIQHGPPSREMALSQKAA